MSRGKWPCFLRSRLFLMGYSCRNGTFRNSPTSHTTTRFTPAFARAFETLCQNRSRVTTVSTPASVQRLSNSRGVYRGFVCTTIPPARSTAKKATMKWGVFGRTRDTRSPGRTPILRRPPRGGDARRPPSAPPPGVRRGCRGGRAPPRGFLGLANGRAPPRAGRRGGEGRFFWGGLPQGGGARQFLCRTRHGRMVPAL